MTVEIRIKDDDSLEVTGNFDLVDADGNVYGAEGPISRETAQGGLTKYLR